MELCGLRSLYGDAIPGRVLADRLASYVHLFNLYWYTRCARRQSWLLSAEQVGRFCATLRGLLCAPRGCAACTLPHLKLLIGFGKHSDMMGVFVCCELERGLPNAIAKT